MSTDAKIALTGRAIGISQLAALIAIAAGGLIWAKDQEARIAKVEIALRHQDETYRTVKDDLRRIEAKLDRLYELRTR